MGGRKKVTWGDLPLFLMDFCGLATLARKRLLMSVLFEAFCSSLAGGSFLGVWIISMGSLFKTLTVGWCCWEPCPLPRASVEESSFSVVFAWAEVVYEIRSESTSFRKDCMGSSPNATAIISTSSSSWPHLVGAGSLRAGPIGAAALEKEYWPYGKHFQVCHLKLAQFQ